MRSVGSAVLVALLMTLAGAQQQQGPCPINLAMVVDRSGSIVVDPGPPNWGNWDAVKNFLLGVTGQLDIGPAADQSHVSLVAYSNMAQKEFGWNTPANDVARVLGDLYYSPTGGKTNTTGALQLTNSELFTEEIVSAGVPNILLLVTDGATSSDMKDGLFDAAKELKDKDVRIVGVGVTANINEEELTQLVSNKTTDYIPINDFNALQNFTSQIVQTVCDQPQTPTDDCTLCCDLTCSTYQASRPCYDTCPFDCRELLCPPGTIKLISGGCGDPAQCADECGDTCRIDLLLVVDESGSIGKDSIDVGGPDYWSRDMQPFLSELVIGLDVGDDETHIGLIMYSDNAEVEFDFDTFRNKDDILDYIQNDIQCRCYNGGFTNTSGALWKARQVLNSNESGNRVNVSNVVLLITDGDDNWDRDLLYLEALRLERVAKLIAVGVSDQVDRPRLRGMLENPAGDYFDVSDFDQLQNILAQVIEQTCNRCPLECDLLCCNLTCDSPAGRDCYDNCPVECRGILCPEGTIELPDGSCVPASLCQTGECETECLIDLVLVLDESGSIGIDSTKEGGPDFWAEDIRPFVVELITGLQIGPDQTRVSLVTFNNDAVRHFELGEITTKEEVRSYILDMPCRCYDGGFTNTSGALAEATLVLDGAGNRDGFPDVVLLLTDGQDNLATRYLQAEAIRLTRRARFLAVGVSKDVNAIRLGSIVVNPATDYFDVDDFNALPAILNNVIATTCNICPVDECDLCCDVTCDTLGGRDCSNNCPESCRVNSNLCARSMPVRLPSGECGMPSQCTDECGEECRIDLLLVVDESGSVGKDSIDVGGPDYWARDMQPFIRNLITSLPIAPNGANVGLIMFSNNARVVYDLNDYTDIPTMRQRIDNIVCRCYGGGPTNTSGALYVARQLLNRPGRGNRPGVLNIVLLITDGQDNVDGAFLAREARLLEREARLMAIGVSVNVNRPRLQGILINPARDYLGVDQFDELGNQIDEALQQTCNLCPPDPCDLCCDLTCDTLPSGRACFQDCPRECDSVICSRNTPVRLPNGQCGVPAQCQPTECAKTTKDCRVDLMLIVDHSGSVGKDSMDKGGPDYWSRDMRPFIRNLVTGLQIGENDTRVSTVVYNDFSELEFGYNDIYDKQAMRDHIDNIYCRCYDGGYTNTSGALWFSRQVMNNPTFGNRPEVEDITMLLTDGLDNKGAAHLDEQAIAMTRQSSLLVVGVSDEVNRLRLEGMVVNPATDYFMVDQFDELSQVLDGIIVRTCNLCVDECEDCCNITCSTLDGRTCHDECSFECRERVLCPPGTPVRLSDGTCGVPDECPLSQCTEDEDCRVDLLLIVDESGSVGTDSIKVGGPNYWQEDMQPFLLDLVAGLQVDTDQTRVALIMYNNDARMNFDFDDFSSRSGMMNYISNIDCRCMDPAGGWTNTSGALRFAKQFLNAPNTGNRADVQNVIWVITDGLDNLDRPYFHSAARDLETDAKLMAIGVSEKVDRQRLESILENPAQDYFNVEQFDQLSTVLDDVTRQSCNICPRPCEELCCNLTCGRLEENQCFEQCPDECRDRLCPASLPVQLPDGHCGTSTECPAQECDDDCRIDLLIMVDESGSIGIDSTRVGGPDHWATSMRPFIRDLISGLEIGPDQTHVAMLTFNNDAQERFTFTDFMDKNSMMGWIDNMHCRCYDGGYTNTSGALWLAKQILDSPASGNRLDVPDVAMLLTDGRDNFGRFNLKAFARLLQNQARLLVVGVSEDVNQERLESILDDPENNYFFVDQFDELSGIIDDVISSTCGGCPCPKPTPIDQVYAFHAYSLATMLAMDGGDMLVFEGVYTNMGGGYDPATGVFTCPCTGLFFFLHSYSGAGCGLSTVIMMDDTPVSTVATVDYHGTLTTSAVTTCRTGQRVYVRVLHFDGRHADFTHLGMSKIYFQGYMIHALDL